MRVVQVVIGITHHALDRLFTYAAQEDLWNQIDVGSVVEVPFGKANSRRKAYVLKKGYLTKTTDYSLKQVLGVVEDVDVEKELIQLAYWMHQRYHAPLSSTLALMLPSDIKASVKKERTLNVGLVEIDKIKAYLNESEKNARLTIRNNLLKTILADYDLHQKKNASNMEMSLPIKEASARYQTNPAMLNTLVALSLLRMEEKEIGRRIDILENTRRTQAFPLTGEQENAVSTIQDSFGQSNVFLIHGVTGSGKTEIYMQLIRQVIDQGQSAIVLIPEISLTPLMIRRFVERFGHVIGVIHSRLNPGERYEQWQKAKNGQIKIMIGPRSAIFAPFERLGLIVIDEEHETSYKSEASPRYHAREIAIKRGLYHHCPVVLGSATPLVESYFKAQQGTYHLIRLKRRAVESSSRHNMIVDMRQELEQGNMSMLSTTLSSTIQDTLEKGQQIILFINRRGYANFVSCRKCGFVYTCPNCDVSMTYHATKGRVICHYCGHSEKVTSTCPSCGSKYIKPFGIGTQKVERYIKKKFPEAHVARMDQDTTRKKNGHQEILDAFGNHKIDILIGTQMIAKGHDFHNVALVGVLAADLSLHMDDYRASEKTFQLVTQVIGRTGRGDIPGRSIIQTYSPDHFALVSALHEDYEAFYKEEILYRKAMIYPPFSHILQILIQSSKEEIAEKESQNLFEEIQTHITKNPEGDSIILGPAKATIGKIKEQYRYRLLVKGSSYRQLTNIVKELYNRKHPTNDLYQLIMDINPMNLI